MFSTFKRILLHSTLHDENPAIEKAYRRYKATRAQESSLVYILAIIVQQALLIGLSALYYDYPVIVRESVFIALTLLIALFKNKLKGWFLPLLFIISCAVYINGILTLGLEFSDLTLRSVYLQSYFLGVFQQLLMILMFRFQFTILFHIILIGIQCFVSITIGFGREKEFIAEIIISICLNLVFFFVMFHFENNDRKIFRMYQKNLLANSAQKPTVDTILIKTMPQSILMITKNLNRVLFTNNSFERNFNSTNQSVTQPKILEEFFVSRNHFNTQEKFDSVFDHDQTCLDLHMFLERSHLMGLQESFTENFVIYSSYLNPNLQSTKNLFELTIFNTIHEGETVLAILFNNVTQQKAFVSSRASDVSKDKLLATISHELKTPLNGVLGGLNMALQTSKDEETISSLNMSKRSAKLLISTVNSFLDLHNMRRNNLRLRSFRVQLSKLLEEVDSLFESQCAQKGLVLKTEILPEVPTFIQTDKERLSQILINLLMNSIKFTQAGEVTLRVSLDPNCKGNLLFQVVDTGIGIKPEDQCRILARMYGNDLEEDAVGAQGVGLGLTVSNCLAKLMNKDGEGIKCVSEPKKGSTFSFAISKSLVVPSQAGSEDDIISFLEDVGDQGLERKMSRYGQRKDSPSRNFEFSKLNISLSHGVKDHEESLFNNSSYPSPEFDSTNGKLIKSNTDFALRSPLNPKKKTSAGLFLSQCRTEAVVPMLKGWVLLVDDNPFNLIVARAVVEKIGYNVNTACNGEDAIKKIKAQMTTYKEFFKLILMDCQMPVMDGYEATRQIRKLMQSKEIPTCPIVALTANDSEEDKKKCRESGMDDVLSKPLLEDDIKKMKAYLGES